MAVQNHSTSAPHSTRTVNQAGTTPLPLRSKSHHRATKPIKAGKTITSRDIQEVRHISTARQARILWPRCKKDAARPATSITSPKPTASSTKL